MAIIGNLAPKRRSRADAADSADIGWQRAHSVLIFAPMSAVLSPIVSEFETEEQEASYDQWFRAKVEEALRSEKPRLSHDAAMAKVQALLDERRLARANRPVD